MNRKQFLNMILAVVGLCNTFFQYAEIMQNDQNEHVEQVSGEVVSQEVVALERKEQPDAYSRIKESFVQGAESSVKLIVPTVVVTSVVMLMLYKTYCSFHGSMTAATESFEGMKKSFTEISSSFKEIKGSMEGSQKAFKEMDISLKKFVQDTENFFKKVDGSWAAYLFSSSQKA